jgi:mono/diheme cytochrome c family protein
MVTTVAARCGTLLFVAWVAVIAVKCALAEAPGDDRVKRGEYLARAGDCIACHTAPGGRPFSGGVELKTPFGSIFSPNITPDKQTGIGEWSDEEFYRAMHEGIGRHGEYLYPAFPFPWYTNVSRHDVLAIKAYLFSLAPVQAPRKPINLKFPFNIRDSLLTWRSLFFREGSPSETAPSGRNSLRGAYLVEGLGHCGECHNRHNLLGASQWSGRLQGGPIEGWYAPNITSDGSQGVGSWTEDQIATFLKTGAAPGKGVVLGPMQETINQSLQFLSDDDLHAIAAYLKSVPAAKTHEDVPASDYESRRAPGAGAYLDNCASCHGVDGKGLSGKVPSLSGDGAVIAQGAENVIDVVLGGLPASHGFAPMPAVGVGMNDQQIADAVNYVRNNFGNTAPANAEAGQVNKLRESSRTTMTASNSKDCPSVDDKDVAALLKEGGEDALKNATQESMLSIVDDLVRKLKSASPNIASDAAVNSLTAAYCKVITADPKASQADREERIGNFSVLAYSQLQSLGAP